LADTLELDSGGYIRTGSALAQLGAYAELGRGPLPLETSAPGVFAAGDVRSGAVQRVASAVGEGAMAVRLVHEHLSWIGSPGAAPAEPIEGADGGLIRRA
jgi:thioredoxin reductase (NADPH)